ncbi:hypothetical protein CFIMG_004430RAa [Ceratocystis fimbriata CBS 114723]|uniref:Uncharacterized protein n=1 Tax=Ceratocystis fimbriata CBS 114723 TaxID=1035309 RepID=A0A2C5WYY7_9PEZI|nr:hypothetical protein CFIMG_004430RAa [Ceratocystis fimbriata CBS 114723]
MPCRPAHTFSSISPMQFVGIAETDNVPSDAVSGYWRRHADKKPTQTEYKPNSEQSRKIEMHMQNTTESRLHCATLLCW